jgi:TonB family protein
MSPSATVQQRFVFLMQDRLAMLQPDPNGKTTYITAPRPDVSANNIYFEFQVERAASPIEGSPVPQYPDSLRATGLEGLVLVQFVVTADGLPVVSTFKVLRSNYRMFDESVRAALPMMKFRPAQVGGRAVSQLVQMPFEFKPPKP